MRILFVANLDPRQRYRFVMEPMQKVGLHVECIKERRNILKSFARAVGYLRSEPNPDIVVLTGGDLRNLLWFTIFRFMTRAKIVLRFGGDPIAVRQSSQQAFLNPKGIVTYLRSRIGVSGTRLMLKRADGVIGVSEYLVEQMRPLLGPNCKTCVSPPVPNIKGSIINTETLPTRRNPVTHILTVANMHYREKADGVLAIARALGQCARHLGPDYMIQYDVVGGGSQTDYLEHRIGGLDIPGNLEINQHGQLSDVSHFYEWADIFAYGSTLDSYPLVLIEAAAYGLPVVINRWGPFPDIFEEGGEAIFYDLSRPDTLVDALSYVITDHGLRKRLSRQVRMGYDLKYSATARGYDLQRFVNELVECT